MMLPWRRVRAALLLAPGLLVITALPGFAVDLVTLRLATIAGAGWSAQTVTLQLNLLDDRHAGLLLQAQRVALPDGFGELSDITLSCARAQITTTAVSCTEGILKTQSTLLGQQHISVTFSYQLDSGRIDASLQGIQAYDGTLELRARLSDARWQIDATGTALSLPAVTRQMVAAGIALPVVAGSAGLDVTARLSGVSSQLHEGDVEVRLLAEEISDAAGSVAAENLDVSLHATVKAIASGMRVVLDISGRQGALYIDPVYVEMPPQPLQINARFDWSSAGQQLLLHSLRYRHPGSVLVEGHGLFRLAADAPIRDLQLDLQQANFPSLYDTYLRPWLYGSMLADLDTTGELSGTLDWEQGKLSRVSLEPVNLSVTDREGRFGLNAVNGRVRWADTAMPARSELAWSSGSVFQVALGATDLVIDAGHDYVRLAQPVAIPVLDGALQIAEFQLQPGADAAWRWQFDGLLEPVSLSQLSLALGWPELAGKLSGVIPDVHYDNGDLEVGGVLLIRAFEGEITLRNLKLQQPFGLVPRLQVDARADNIDLETLTRTFSFGRIEGRLDGRIDGLQLESWRPVAFDAVFATPEDDNSRHRISQKAVDNISSIGGGGVGGALSRSFLRFFEEFPYDRLGIRCRLERGICDMGGVQAAPEGYYLVKGRLIPPRLDVIGYADRVNWDTLIAQILAVIGRQEVHVE